MPIGWAFIGNPSKNRLNSSWSRVCRVTWVDQSTSWRSVGSSPKISNHAVSRNVERSASCSMGYPR